jgi:hypothetical protein
MDLIKAFLSSMEAGIDKSRNPMGCIMRHCALWLILSGFPAGIGAAQPYVPEARTFSLSLDDWARPRSGETLVGFQALRDMAAIWSAGGGKATIEIRYPGGDEGGLWAGELADWLVALGIPSNRIQLTPGNARVDRIDLLIQPERP